MCFDCITISNLLHNVQHHFLKILDPLDPKEDPVDITAASVTVFPKLPNKEELLVLLREEEKRRFSPEVQKQYYEVGIDPTCGKDWMDVTDQMQHELVREFGYSDEAVQLLRRAPQLFPGKRMHHLFLFLLPLMLKLINLRCLFLTFRRSCIFYNSGICS